MLEGERGQAACRGFPQRLRGVRIGDGPAQLGDEATQRQRPRRPSVAVHGTDLELGQEPGRLLALVVGGLHRRDDQPSARAGAGDVEESALLHQQCPGGDRRHQVGSARGIETDPVGPQQAGASAQVRPALLLHVRHHDELPLQALGPVGGEEAHGRTSHTPLGERVSGDLLGDEVGEERGHPDVVAVLDRASRHLEERADRVEVTVCATRAGAALVDLTTQAVGPAGARPEVPEDVLDAGALLEERRSRAQQGRQGPTALDLRAVQPGEEAVSDDGEPQQLTARALAVAAPCRAHAGVVRARAGHPRRALRGATAAATRCARDRGTRASRGRRCRG